MQYATQLGIILRDSNRTHNLAVTSQEPIIPPTTVNALSYPHENQENSQQFATVLHPDQTFLCWGSNRQSGASMIMLSAKNIMTEK